MRVVIQRVSSASVSIGGVRKGSIGPGLLVLVGIEEPDGVDDIAWLCQKIVHLRVFNDAEGVMNRSVCEAGGGILAISQFTLYASYKKGNRPSYLRAARPELSAPLYDQFCQTLSAALGQEVQTGVFGADMQVELLNDGPVTICMDSKNRE